MSIHNTCLMSSHVQMSVSFFLFSGVQLSCRFDGHGQPPHRFVLGNNTSKPPAIVETVPHLDVISNGAMLVTQLTFTAKQIDG